MNRVQSTTVVEFVASSERERAAAMWQQLEKRVDNHFITCSWQWTATWLCSFGDSVPHTFAFGTQDGRTIGAALITQPRLEVGAISVPAIFIGTAGEDRSEPTYVQYNRLLVEPAMLQPFAAGLMSELLRRKWSVLRLNGFVPEHAEALMRAGRDLGVEFQAETSPSPTFDFEKLGPNQDVMSALSHDTRSKLRRSMRFLTEKLGPVSVEWAETHDHACGILEELSELHTTQWNNRGETGALYSDRLQRYHRELVDRLFPEHAILFRVRQGDTTIGCLLNLVEDGHVTNHRSGIRFFPDDNRLKPGYITDLLFMEEARKRGYAEYDLLTGHEYYKRLITNSEHSMIWAIAGRGLRSRVFEAARKLYWHPRYRPAVRRLEKVLHRRPVAIGR